MSLASRVPVACLAVWMGAGALPALAQSPPRPPQAAARPAGELVTEATLSRDGLKAAFDAAKLPTAIDGGGNLTVRFAQVTVHVLPGKDSIRLLVSYAFAPRSALQERLDLANRINDGYIMARAAVPAERTGELAVDHYIVLGPGVSRAAIVAVTRRFAEVVVEAVGALDSDGLLT